MFGGRRRVEAQAQARAAKGEAAVAFYRMDETQRQVSDRLTFAAHVDGGPRGAWLLDRLRQAVAEADAAAAQWLALGERLDPDSEALETADYEAAGRGYAEASGRLDAARQRLEQLQVEVASELATVEAALAAVPARVNAAREALARAEAAVAAVEADGLPAPQARAVLDQARTRAVVLEEGAAVHGIAATLAAADDVAAAAAEAQRHAEELPRQREDTQRRLLSVQTRLEATKQKTERAQAGLSALRRGYVEGCWTDLTDNPRRVDDAVADASRQLDAARVAARRQAYPEALRLLDAARAALGRADEAVKAVTDRLSTLHQLQADPSARVGEVRFAIRDAQRLCLANGRPDPRHVRELDALVARLDAAPAMLARPHPDYLAYLRELDSIKSGAARVVGDIRAARRGR